MNAPYPNPPAALDDVWPALSDAASETSDALMALTKCEARLGTAYPVEALIALRTALDSLKEAVRALEQDAEPVIRKLAELASEED